MADVTSHKNQEFEIEEVFSHTVESVLEMSYDCGTLVLRTWHAVTVMVSCPNILIGQAVMSHAVIGRLCTVTVPRVTVTQYKIYSKQQTRQSRLTTSPKQLSIFTWQNHDHDHDHVTTRHVLSHTNTKSGQLNMTNKHATSTAHTSILEFWEFYSHYDDPAWILMSSILRIILTSCVARLICCFFPISVSITCCFFISGK